MTTSPESSKLLAMYVNGNYRVTLFSDGTKIKRTQGDEFKADFPDSIDIKITNYCDMACPMCHESSGVSGCHADLSADFLATLHAGTELAIGGGNPLSHPELPAFLTRMKGRRVVCNLTVNEKHFLANQELLSRWLSDRLIWGLGISLNAYNPETLKFASENKTAVLHAICGIITEAQLQRLYDKGLKILFLGYKRFGRGESYFFPQVESNIDWLKGEITKISRRFDIVCFDNLALEQLDLQSQIPEQLFESRYMGDDGVSSMYVDLVNGEFAVSSTSKTRFPLTDNIESMFEVIKNNK